MPVIVLCLLTSNKNYLFYLLVSNKSVIFAHVFIFSIQMHHGNQHDPKGYHFRQGLATYFTKPLNICSDFHLGRHFFGLVVGQGTLILLEKR